MFDQFKKVYPRREKWPPAERAFKKLSKAEQQAAIEDCQTRYIGIEKCYNPLPASYLNARSWEDDPIPKKETKQQAGVGGSASFKMWKPED